MTNSLDGSATKLLDLDAARIDGESGLLVEGLSVSSDARRLALVGDWRALTHLLTGQARLSAGSATIAGHAAASAIAAGMVGFAIGDAPLPPTWTASRYLEASARLTGSTGSIARSQAATALTSLGLAALGGRRVNTLDAVERRFVLVAHATINNPAVLFLDRPLAGLDESRQQALRDVITRASEASRLVLTTPSLNLTPTERTLLDTCDDVIVLENGSIVAQGRAAELVTPARRYAVRVTRNATPFIELLNGNGFTARPAGPFGLEPSGGGRLIVELGESTQSDRILDLCLDADAPIMEFLPL